MGCYINGLVTDKEVTTDIKQLIPDAAIRRRMSKVIKKAVATAVECVGSVDGIETLDAIITATGWGCLADSERFLHNLISSKEQLLNPTPFIQSTFNTVGGQIALLRHNHCYNVTYVNRGHSFEDAMLDAMLRIIDGESENILVGAFDELTPTLNRVFDRMGVLRKTPLGEGSMFVHITSRKTESSVAEVIKIDYPHKTLTKDECLVCYSSSANSCVLYNTYSHYGLFPTVSALCFADAVRMIKSGLEEVIVYNEVFGSTPVVIIIKCIG